MLGDAAADATRAGMLLKDEQARAESYKNPYSGARISEADFNLWQAASAANPPTFVPVAWRPGMPLPTPEQIGRMVSADYPQGMRPTTEAEFKDYLLLTQSEQAYADLWERAKSNGWIVPVDWKPGQPAPLPSAIQRMVSPSYPQGFRPTTEWEFKAYANAVAEANAKIQASIDNGWFVPAGWSVGDIGVRPSQIAAMISIDYPGGTRPATKDEFDAFQAAMATMVADEQAAVANGWVVPVRWRRGWPPPTQAALKSMATEDYPTGWRPATKEEFGVFSATVDAVLAARTQGVAAADIVAMVQSLGTGRGIGTVGTLAGVGLLGLVGYHLLRKRKGGKS
jgi:hypothetical protein